VLPAHKTAGGHRRIGPGDVAAEVGAETRTLQNYFWDAIQRPIATEIRVRVERAKRELAQIDRPLDAVARDVGFGNTQRLHEVFRRELGVAPVEYGNQRRLRHKK
jgi:LacI family transcriptional regulator